jgi:hypothetical protein
VAQKLIRVTRPPKLAVVICDPSNNTKVDCGAALVLFAK